MASENSTFHASKNAVMLLLRKFWQIIRFVNTFERWRLVIWRAKSKLNLRNFLNHEVSRTSSNICKKEILVSASVINVPKNLLLAYGFFETCEKKFRSPHINFLSWNADQRQIWTRHGPDLAIDGHEIFPHGRYSTHIHIHAISLEAYVISSQLYKTINVIY